MMEGLKGVLVSSVSISACLSAPAKVDARLFVGFISG